MELVFCGHRNVQCAVIWAASRYLYYYISFRQLLGTVALLQREYSVLERILTYIHILANLAYIHILTHIHILAILAYIHILTYIHILAYVCAGACSFIHTHSNIRAYPCYFNIHTHSNTHTYSCMCVLEHP